MDFSSKFSLVDFLAYLFPGFVSIIGILFALPLTLPEIAPFSLLNDLLVGLLLILSLSYVMGVVLSGFAEICVNYIAVQRNSKWVKETIPVPGFEKEIMVAFADVFRTSTQENETEWSATCFHLCRSLVFENMPGSAQISQRQSSLRQLRMNLLPAATIWMIVGIAWGRNYLINDLPVWGYGLIIGSSLFWLLIMLTMIDRMNRNERRETREILTAFLAGYKQGLFKSPD